MNKSIYVTFDGLREEIIDSFIRNNDKSAIVDVRNAFIKQADDNTHLILYKVIHAEDESILEYDILCGIPVIEIYDSDKDETLKIEDEK